MTESAKPGYRYWSLVKAVWLPLNQSWDDGPDEFLRQFHAVRPEVGHLYAAHWCQSEVCNGGLDQFFDNTTGILAPEALDGFRAIGLAEWANILAEAMLFFGSPYPRERVNRQKLLASRRGRGRKREEWDSFSALDERFFAWVNAEPNRWERAADLHAKATNA